MKYNTRKALEDQSGQTLVEFVLLMAAIVIISFSFLKIVNNFTTETWVKMATIILDDETQQLDI